jgi:hypothetical protein
LVLIDKKRNATIAKLEIGSQEAPVVNDIYGYGVTRSQEEQEEYERGIAKMGDAFNKTRREVSRPSGRR